MFPLMLNRSEFLRVSNIHGAMNIVTVSHQCLKAVQTLDGLNFKLKSIYHSVLKDDIGYVNL